MSIARELVIGCQRSSKPIFHQVDTLQNRQCNASADRVLVVEGQDGAVRPATGRNDRTIRRGGHDRRLAMGYDLRLRLGGRQCRQTPPVSV